MDRKLLWDKCKTQKIFVIGCFIIGVFLVISSTMAVGYSTKNHNTIAIDASDVGIYKNPGSRVYSESYEIKAEEDIHVDCLYVSYIAQNLHFKGVLKANISENGKILENASVKILETEKTEDISTAKLSFGINAQLYKDHSYILNIQIDSNMSDYRIKVFHLSDSQNYLSGELMRKNSMVSGLLYTPITPMHYYEIFYGLIPLLIISGVFWAFKKSAARIWGKVTSIISCGIREHGNECILILMFVFLAIYELYYAYAKNVFISPDSANYLSEANAILAGNGFNQTAQSGYDSWFSLWPIGYPLMIAGVSFLTRTNVYFASKILSIVLVGLFLNFLYIKFKKDAWIYSFCLINVGFLNIFGYTWSENPFCLGLLIFCLILSYIIERETVKFRWFVLWGLSSVFMFLCRYIGVFSFMVIGIVFIIYMGIYILIPKYRNSNIRAKWIGCIIAEMISGIAIGNYCMLNFFMTGTLSGRDRGIWWDEYTILTKDMYNSLVREFFNATRLAIPSGLLNLSWHYKAIFVCLFLITILFLLVKYKAVDYRLAFIGIGLFYDIVFIFIRYHSSMDAFSYRFFAPASILITIGLLGFCIDFVNKYRYEVMSITIGILLMASAIMGYSFRYINHQNTAYKFYKENHEQVVLDVPEKSTILGKDDIDFRGIAIFRPDINFVSETIGINDTMDALLKRYGKSDYICIKAKHIKDILFYPVYDYDKSVIDFFSEVKEDIPDEKYLIVSIKEKKIKK